LYVRKISFETFCESNGFNISELAEDDIDKEIDDSISLVEVKSIVLSNVTKTKNEEYKFKEKKLTKILMDINSRILSNSLSSLVKKNLVEVAFDEKQNDFVFWVKDKND
jgi:uncharacterized membrane protein YheB (UPF0754 family)